MADMVMCLGDGCKRREQCYRYTAPVNLYMQSVFTEVPEEPCEEFWDNTGMMDGRKVGHWWKRKQSSSEEWNRRADDGKSQMDGG